MTVALLRAAADRVKFRGTPNYMPTAGITTPTYDGSGETTEPTYRYFAAGKLGHKYWLAHNPLPAVGSPAYENPCLLVSDDRVTWSVPAGASMPIEPAPATGNNADCFILFDPTSSNIYMFWNLTGSGGTDGIYYRVSTDCVTWGAKQTAFTMSGAGDGNGCLEPKVIYDAVRNRWAMFTITAGLGSMRVQFASAPTGPWGVPGTVATLCVLTPNVTIWHMDIITLPDGRFLMTFCDNADQNNRKGYLATSSDGTNWRVAPRPFLSANSWGIKGPYRPSIQPAASGAGYDIITALQAAPNSHLGLATNIPLSEIP